MAIEDARKEEILRLAKDVNAASEKYQLIHATFAIEKLQDDVRKKLYADEFKSLRNLMAEAKEESNKETVEFLLNKAMLLRSSFSNTKIQVEYLKHITDECARTHRTHNGVFIISIPEDYMNLRDEDGKINFDKMKKLRRLMAHELGHIMLHADFLGPKRKSMTDCEEVEADYFAEQLISLRIERNKEIHENQHYCEF